MYKENASVYMNYNEHVYRDYIGLYYSKAGT